MIEQILKDSKVSSTDGTGSVVQRDVMYDHVEVRIAAGILDLAKNTVWVDAVDMTGLWIGKIEDGWLIALRGVRSGRKLVAYFNAPSFQSALTLAATSVDSGHAVWRLDKK